MRRLLWIALLAAMISGCNSGAKKSASSEPQITEITMKVDGMHCMGCVETVQVSARQLDGVDSAFASLAEASARVVFDAAKIDTTAIREAIELNGYKVTEIKISK